MSATELQATELYAELYEPLRRYLARFTGDSELAADIAHDAFVRLLERPPETAARPWLFRVATNLARDDRRARIRHRLLSFRGRAQLAHADPPPSPDQAVDRTVARRLVNHALDALSPKERMALLMREEGFAHREIAEAVGTTTGSVGTLLARAIAKAASRLEQPQEE